MFNWACDDFRRFAALTLVLRWYISPSSYHCIDAQASRVNIPSLLDRALNEYLAKAEDLTLRFEVFEDTYSVPASTLG
jgi:hypothetical protein